MLRARPRKTRHPRAMILRSWFQSRPRPELMPGSRSSRAILGNLLRPIRSRPQNWSFRRTQIFLQNLWSHPSFLRLMKFTKMRLISFSRSHWNKVKFFISRFLKSRIQDLKQQEVFTCILWRPIVTLTSQDISSQLTSVLVSMWSRSHCRTQVASPWVRHR